MARPKLPITLRTEKLRTWFRDCDPKDTQTRDRLKRAAKVLWERQTHEEQETATTIAHNGIGYNGKDAEFASRIINWKGTLTEKMALGARTMLQKYSRQFASISLANQQGSYHGETNQGRKGNRQSS